MKKTLTLIFFVACILALIKQEASSQTPYDSLYGANVQGCVYIREDVVDICTNELVQSIKIGGSVTGWELREAKLYGDQSNPNKPGYYILKIGKRLKLGREAILYAQISENDWLPGSALSRALDIFRDEDVIANDQGDGYNYIAVINDYIIFDFLE